MLSPTGWWLALAPVDLRCGMDRLLVAVGRDLGRDARDGGAYVFRNRSGTRIKVLCVDAQGVWLSVRRLHEGAFHWPRSGDAAWSLTREQFAWLVAGVDWQRLSRDTSALPKII
ncbi:IS66 family insertion sequence element accessory protein TnpB [Dokdonella fugitiva]|uniref:IS66 family insertion sequence element accessory protein TnpB n=1 Tax=Dokdonella fugitiva TaxID=328517 RepID=UPI0015FA87F8|nr:IS66 family insertion sequence element accessory protein TnpB [Dokdonella fugitiva]